MRHYVKSQPQFIKMFGKLMIFLWVRQIATIISFRGCYCGRMFFEKNFVETLSSRTYTKRCNVHSTQQRQESQWQLRVSMLRRTHSVKYLYAPQLVGAFHRAKYSIGRYIAVPYKNVLHTLLKTIKRKRDIALNIQHFSL